jgi:hypothetical protein
MLTRVKQIQLAAVAALAVMFTANASLSPANAQKADLKVGQTEKQGSRGSSNDGMKGSSNSDRGSMKGSSNNDRAMTTQRSSNDRGMTSQRSSTRVVRSNDGDRSVSRRTTVRTGNNNTVRATHTSNRNWDRRHHRYYRGRSTIAFVVLGPRAVYRSYGSGWCRALHSGRHYAPRIGWHGGRHVGAVRCG